MDLGKEAPGSGCDVRAGGGVAGDTSLSVRDDVETYMFLLHLGACILKFPSPVLGVRARGLSLLGLIPGSHVLAIGQALHFNKGVHLQFCVSK